MIRVLAIDFNQSPASAVLARIERERPIEIVSIGKISETEWSSSDDEESGATSIEYSLEIDLSDGGIDRSLALLNTQELVYTSVQLPFNDPKKISQVVPLQLQDALPFDVGSCELESCISKIGESSNFRVLTAVTPRTSVANTLEVLTKVGIDPVRLSTHASCLAQLYLATKQNSGEPRDEGLVALVNIQDSSIVLVALYEDTPCMYREWNTTENHDPQDSFADIKASIAAAEADMESTCTSVYVLGSNEMLELAKQRLGQSVHLLHLESLVENHTNENIALDKVSWAIGLVAQEKWQSSLENPSINFRKGAFAYQRAWGSIWEALRAEATFFVLAAVFLIGFVFSKWWAIHQQVETVEQKIASITAQAQSSETIPRGNEVAFLESAIEEQETQLLEMGSLASLSPLESLRLLSTTIPPSIQVEIESVTIGFSRILLRGTVPDTPTLGTLETALKGPAKKFCAVTVDPTGRQPGSSKQRFTAEIEVCE